MNRRQFIYMTGAAVGAPAILRFGRAAAQTPRVRRSLASLSLTDPFFTQYGEAIRAMHRLPETDRRSWRGQAMIHADFCPHGTDGFILWHRHYITFFERLCAALIGNPDFTLPYWDWTANNGRLPAPFAAEGNPLNIATWRDRSDYRNVRTSGTRAINARRGLLDDPARSGAFRPRQLNAIQQQREFSLFQAMLENTPHNTAHTMVGGNGGHMVDMMSPLDPIFWLHHCNVDRLAAQWQRAGGRIPANASAYSRQFVDAQGAAMSVTAAQALDFAAMGFTYDVLGEAVVASRPAETPPPPPQARQMPAQPSASAEPPREVPARQPAPTPSAEPSSNAGSPRARGQDQDFDGVIIDGPRQGSGGRPSRSDDLGIAMDDAISSRRDPSRQDPSRQDHSNHEQPTTRSMRGAGHDDHAGHAQAVPAGISVIGRSDAAQPCAINQATRIAVATEQLFNDIVAGQSRRGLRSREAGAPADDRRILARLSVRDLQGDVNRCLVNVFVNAADASPQTSSDDPRYVGSFSFFGQSHVGHDRSFVVDVTEAVRGQAADGRIGGAGGLDVQVLPVTADPSAPAEARFLVERVELISG